ncbi:MAG TPA: ABC transporter permease [Terriglobales bacterium]|nr:ABC transporter permease [Terriglobales bacterium]
MNKVLRMAWMNVLLSYRIKIAFFFTFIFPMMFFFIYFGLIARGNPLAVEAMMGPLISFSVISNALFGLSVQLVTMRERDMLRRYHLAPIRAAEMVGSRLLSNYLLFLPIVVLQYALAVWMFHMPVHGSLLALWLVFTLGYLSLGAIGLVVAGIVDTVQEATVWNQILFFALLFLTGTTFPLAQLPRIVQHLALFMPPTLMILGSAGIMLGGQGVVQNLPEIIGLALITVSSLGLGVALFRWEKEEKTTRRGRLQAALALIPLLAVGLWLNYSPSYQKKNQASLNASAQAFHNAIR